MTGDTARQDALLRYLQDSASFEQPVAKASWTFPLPFVAYSALEHDESCWGPPPRTLAELRMYALSWTIRSKPDWRRKIEDAQILEKWRKEATEQQETLPKYKKLTPNMINFALTELAAYSQLADNSLSIEAGPFDAIWFSDRLISDDLSALLRAEAAKLEDEEKDWHPGSNGQVLDLVHPSLYPIMYGRTTSTSHAQIEPPYEEGWRSHHDWHSSWAPNNIAMDCVSQKYSWLPSDFAVSDEHDGTPEVRLLSPYINNLHPTQHGGLYTIIERIVGVFIPMFERVLSQVNGSERDLLRSWQQDEAPGSGRIRMHYKHGIFIGYEMKFVGLSVPCIWNGEMRYRKQFESRAQYLDAIEVLPEAHEKDNGALQKSIIPYSLRGKTIQCIIKLANIHLTPENKDYPGGSWHVEGMLNERIVASGIYYYDEENITESRLAFRVTTSPPVYHRQDDELCSKVLYGMKRKSHCVQDIGSIETKSGRALVWPNIYQHRVSPFSLKDPSRPGHRKILAIFLVDPSIEPIPSATTVPPQQVNWALVAMEEAQRDPQSLVSRLPPELVYAICEELEHAGGQYLGRTEAEKTRLDLMAERTVFVKGRRRELMNSFHMCEH